MIGLDTPCASLYLFGINADFSSQSTGFHRLAPRMGVVSTLAQEYSPGIGVARSERAAHHHGTHGAGNRTGSALEISKFRAFPSSLFRSVVCRLSRLIRGFMFTRLVPFWKRKIQDVALVT